MTDAYIEGAKPSIETFLHSISGRYSLHTHPTVVNAIACRKDGKEIFRDLFPEALIVPFATPGFELAKSYFKEYRDYKLIHNHEPQLVFLMNHGFLTSADTAQEVIDITESVIEQIGEYLGIDMKQYHDVTALSELYADGIIWKVTDKNVIDSYEKFGKAWDHYFCPDCVVFLGNRFYETKGMIDKDDFDNFCNENGVPVVIIHKQNIYIHAESVKKQWKYKVY